MTEPSSAIPWESAVPLLASTVQARALMKLGVSTLESECGRSLVATENISKGQLVYESQRGQSLKTVDLAFSTRVCLHCGDIACEETFYQPLQCSGCEAAAWCSPECNSADAELHAMTCRFVRPLLLKLRQLHSSFMDESADQEPVEWTEGINLLSILAMLCLRAQHLNLPGSSTQTSIPASLYEGCAGMVSNIGLWPKGTRHSKLLPLWSTCLTHVLPSGWMPPADELLSLQSALTCNVFSMWLPDYSSYGSVIEPWPALLNHSCTPNLARIQTPTGMQFIAIHDIKAGTAFNFSYLPSDATFEERRLATSQEYCFQCRCSRCEAGLELKEGVAEESLPITTACPCGGWMYPGKAGRRVCSMCTDESKADTSTDTLIGGGDASDDDRDYIDDEGDASDDGYASGSDISSCGGGNLASTMCRCGGWRFNNQDEWLCIHCDHTIRVSANRA
mmetsp:Transcript_9039/g.20405  ORF Transcript_9039/g.20405 Transcript_9039/m.20405 type:complete len:450 (-) Transcript_9039:440-1789(-)